MNEITNVDILKFLRLLCNIGGAFHLNEEKMIIEKNDGQACCVQEGDQVKPIQILFSGMVKDDDNAILNPFKMVEGNNPALNWFYQSRFTVISVLVKKMILRIVEVGYTKESEDYDLMRVLAKYSDQCDKTMVDELQKINASDYLRIFYNKKNKTAEAQTAIFTDMLESQHKFRKKTWKVLRDLFREVFQMGDADTMSKYTYRATILSIPEIDAKLHVMGMILKVIDPWCTTLLKTPLESEEFEKHLVNLETYARMYAWFTAKVDGNNNTIVDNHQASGLPVGVSPAWDNKPAVPVTTQQSSRDVNEIRTDVPDAPPLPAPASIAPAPVLPTATPGIPMIPVATPPAPVPAAIMPLPSAPMPTMSMPVAAGVMPSVMPAAPGYGMPGYVPAGMPQMSMMPTAPVGRTYAEELEERNRISTC